MVEQAFERIDTEKDDRSMKVEHDDTKIAHKIEIDSEIMAQEEELEEIEEMTDFNEKLKEYRDLMHLKNKLRKIPAKVLNRRHKKLRELIEEDEYFSEENIRQRAPLLYQMYLGRYIRQNPSSDPFKDPFSTSSGKFYELLQNQACHNSNAEKVKILLNTFPEYKKDLEPTEEYFSPLEQEDNEDLLIRMMHDRFVAGLDSGFFDYATVDENEKYDDVEVTEKDEEAKYFDDIQEEKVPPELSEYTGEQDY